MNLRSSVLDGNNIIHSMVIHQHENTQLAIWGCEKTVKIWNFSVRQTAMDLFKHRVSQFVSVNEHHINSQSHTYAPMGATQLEGTEVLHDDVVKLTNLLMNTSHYRSIVFEYDVLRIFVTTGLVRTYLICNLIDYDDILNNTNSDNNNIGPMICIKDLHTNEHIRSYYGIALFAGNIGMYRNKT